MKRPRLVALLAAVVLAFASSAALAQQSDQHAGRFLGCLKILGLSDQQKTDIKAVLEAEKTVVQGLVETLRTDREALRALLEGGSTDGCAIGNAVLKVKADHEALKAERGKILASVEALLTPEQKAKFEGCLQGPGAQPTPQAATEEIAIALPSLD